MAGRFLNGNLINLNVHDDVHNVVFYYWIFTQYNHILSCYELIQCTISWHLKSMHVILNLLLPFAVLITNASLLLNVIKFQPLLGIFGLFGNLLTVTILSYKEMNNSFNKLIMVLAVFDSVFIIFVTFEYTFVRGKNWII